MTSPSALPTAGPAPPPAPPLLLTVRDLARLLGRSVPSLERDEAAGRLPASVRIGGSKKYRRDEVLAWVAAGCPARCAWSFTPTPRA